MLAAFAQDKTVLVATHVVSDIETVAKEILLLRDGYLVDKNSPQNLIEKYAPNGRIEDVYLTVFGEE